MDVNKVLLSNYLPYAKSTIISRAFPSIDGLKPSQRRILYTMYKMGLVRGNKTKSSNIVGQTMRLHAHGDSSIYDTLVRLSVGYEGLNVPYVDSKGNFGKVYSDELAYAASRYTEAKLTPICKDVFDGIDENAVDLVDNFDGTMKEPTLLPVKFPSILVNPSNGIAVGMSSSIPSFSLKNVCDATINILSGKVNTVEELMDILGVPEFTTGGFVHASREDLIKLGETGKGSFVVSGTVTTYPDRIVISEIPYKVKAEKILADIEKYAKSGELKEVIDTSDEIDLHGFKLVVMLRKSANPKEVLRKLCRYTELRTRISFNTQLIIADRPAEIGLLELLNNWIKFRVEAIDRVYRFRLAKASKEEHLLCTWEKIKQDIKHVAELIASRNDDATLAADLMRLYGLDEIQANHLLDTKIRLISKNNLTKKLADLDKVRKEIAEYNNIIGSDLEKHKIIISDLKNIRDTYGKDNKTHQAEPIVEEPDEKLIEKVDDTLVTVVYTSGGFIKRLVSIRDVANFVIPDGEREIARWNIRNNENILVFTYSGEVYKILVNSIDASKGSLKDEVYKLIGLKNSNEIMLIDACGDYSKYFNLVYPNGRGTRVYYSRVSGNRKHYKGLFDKCEVGRAWCTFADKFFMITARRKAAYCDLELMGKFSNRVAFKVARVNSGDYIWGLQPIEKVPDISKIDISRYHKDYTVAIKNDILWEGASSASTSSTSYTK